MVPAGNDEVFRADKYGHHFNESCTQTGNKRLPPAVTAWFFLVMRSMLPRAGLFVDLVSHVLTVNQHCKDRSTFFLVLLCVGPNIGVL